MAQLRTDLMAVHSIIAERMHLSTMDDDIKLDHLLRFVRNTLEYTARNNSSRSELWELRTLRKFTHNAAVYINHPALD